MFADDIYLTKIQTTLFLIDITQIDNLLHFGHQMLYYNRQYREVDHLANVVTLKQ